MGGQGVQQTRGNRGQARTAFLIHAFPLVYLTMCGRMMQATSDDIRLTLLLEVSSILTEVFEAKDL